MKARMFTPIQVQIYTGSKELSVLWDLSDNFHGDYAEDYQLLSETGSMIKMTWKDKYTTTIFDDLALFQSHTLQPVPDM